MSRADRVIVIGGAGFIGRSLTRRLLQDGNTVTVVSRSVGSRRSNQPGLEYRAGNVVNASQMMEIIGGTSVVYDLSLGGGVSWEDVEREVAGAAVNVARACLKHGVRRLVYTSSIAALYLGGRGVVDDEHKNDADSLNRSLYPRGKGTAERRLLELHAREGLPVVIFRPGIVVGQGGPLAHFALGENPSPTCILGWGRGTHPLPCVLVDDVAEAMFLAKDADGIDGKSFNLAGDVRPTAAQYVQFLRERALRNFRFYGRSLWLIQAGELSRWFMKRLSGKPNSNLSPYRDLKGLTMSAQLDCSRAKQMLGWAPVSDQEEFLRQAVDSLLPPVHPGDVRLETAGRGRG